MNSGTLELIGDLNTIISSLKDEPDMSEISYLVCSAASLVSKRWGLTTTKSTNSQTPTWRRRLDMEILTLRRVISLLLKVRKGSSGIRMCILMSMWCMCLSSEWSPINLHPDSVNEAGWQNETIFPYRCKLKGHNIITKNFFNLGVLSKTKVITIRDFACRSC